MGDFWIKFGCCCLIAMILGMYGGGIYGIYWFIDQIHEKNNWESTMTEESCYVIDWETWYPCEYQCGSDSGTPCYGGYYYNYTVTAIDKCGNDTLLHSILRSNVDCFKHSELPNPKNIDEEYQCWVYDCDKKQMTFDSPLAQVAWLYVAAIVFIFVLVCCPMFIFCLQNSKKSKKSRNKEYGVAFKRLEM